MSAAGAAILRAGGNAFDASVAAGFASTVAEPALTSLGGGGFLLAYEAASGKATAFDFFVDTPGRGRTSAALEPHFIPITIHFTESDQVFNAGRGSVAVPGTLKGLLHVHERLGRLPLEDVLKPAASLAREGIRLNQHQAHFLEILNPIMCLTPDSRGLYSRDGRPFAPGDRWRNPELANFLETLAGDRGASFYEGALAERIDREMREDGLLTAEDLAGYRVIERTPTAVEYRGHRVLTNPPPSFGGSLVTLSLKLLETQPLAELGWGSEDHLALLVTLQMEVDRLRETGCLSPDHPVAEAPAQSVQRLRQAVRGTTHVCVADAEGNVASMTNSNGEGSGFVAPETGIMLNNMMGEDDLHPEGVDASPPGERVASMMSPDPGWHSEAAAANAFAARFCRRSHRSSISSGSSKPLWPPPGFTGTATRCRSSPASRARPLTAWRGAGRSIYGKRVTSTSEVCTRSCRASAEPPISDAAARWRS